MSQFIKFYFTSSVLTHVSDINKSIIRSLRLFYCITILVVCSVKMEVFSISVNARTYNTNKNKLTNCNKATKHNTLKIHLYIYYNLH